MNRTPKQSLQLFLCASYQYYHRFYSLMDDTEYDSLAKYLLKTYDEWQGHQHAYLVSKDDLEAGTMFAVKAKDYPTMVQIASDRMAREHYYKEVK